MQFFSQALFTDLFFFLIQYLQKTCNRHTLCDAIILEKKLHTCCFSYFNSYRGHANNTLSMMQFFSVVLFIDLMFSIIQYIQWTCNGRTHCDAIILQKKVLHTCCFSYFSFYRGNANAILSAMQFFSKVFFTDLLFFLIQCLQRTCDGHTQLKNVLHKNVLQTCTFS